MDFQWFIDLYFNFFERVILQLKHKVTKKHFQEIRMKMLTHIEIFFLMFYYEKRVSELYISRDEKKYTSDFYKWIF